MSVDYSIVGPPTISLEQARGILEAAGSPAAGEAAGIYNAALRYGVDPAVLLAVFGHESSFGKAGVARTTKSVGNLVYTEGSAAMGAMRAGRWAAYRSWTEGALDAARLLGSTLYGRGPAFNTARTFPFRWAPASDGNKPSAYGSAVVATISRWGGGNPARGTLPEAKPAPVKARKGAVSVNPSYRRSAGILLVLIAAVVAVIVFALLLGGGSKSEGGTDAE